MKKLFAVILALTMCFVLTAPVAAAVQEDEVYPIIIVPGYSSSSMYRIDENGDKVHVWGVDLDEILGRVKESAIEIGIDIANLAQGDAKRLADRLGTAMLELYGDLAYDEKGESVYELYRYHKDAEDTSTAWLKENENGAHTHETEIMPYVSQYLGEKADEWTFNFATDFRQNTVDCAKDLDVYIEDVLEYTGASKVNILAVSHGGQTSATYLALYGHKARVNNAVLTVPAIGGALLAYDLLADDIHFDEETLMYFIQNGMMLEEDLDWLMKAHALGFLDDLLHYLMPYAYQLLGRWGSIWDFVPADKYEEIKANFEVTEEFRNSEVMEKCDYFHYELLPNLPSLLEKAEDAGANIYIISGYGNPSVVGTQEESDAIISLNASSGATCAPFGYRFNDGYQVIGKNCDNSAHNHLSPKMNVDATTAYLPETTWFVDGLFHGMTFKDEYSKTLMKLLVESDERVNVRTYEAYPQFHEAMNVCESVYAEFDSSVPGYLDSSDTKLIVTNLSLKNSMQISSISVSGADISFDPTDYLFKALAPGESLELEFDGEVPAESLSVAEVTVAYTLVGSITPLNDKAFYFTLLNGDAPEYDGENPYVKLASDSGFEDHIKDEETLEWFNKLGVTEFFDIIYRAVKNFINRYFGFLIKA